jgi:hypothetical protein
MKSDSANFQNILDHSTTLILKSLTLAAKVPFLGNWVLKNRLLVKMQYEAKRAKYVQNYIDTTLLNFNKNLFDTSIPYGLFAGIRITSLSDLQAGIAQKFLGIYEIEIAQHLTYLLESNDYDYFIDIGAAEGLYALVLDKAIRRKNLPAVVYAFEEDYFVRQLLKRRLKANDSVNVQVLGGFRVHSLNLLNPNRRGFVLSDCEGFEAEIFSEAHRSKFINCDMIIETHDGNSPNVTSKIMALMSKTHDVELVTQLPLSGYLDLIKDDWFNSLSKEERLKLLENSRNQETKWLVITRKSV